MGRVVAPFGLRLPGLTETTSMLGLLSKARCTRSGESETGHISFVNLTDNKPVPAEARSSVRRLDCVDDPKIGHGQVSR